MKKTQIGISNRAKGYGKKVLQFWSGGADSTYLLLQNLLAGNQLYLTYVSIANNKNKVDREKTARKLLSDDIEIFRNYFKCEEPTFIDGNVVQYCGDFQRCNAPQQVIFAMFSFLIGKGYDEIQMGVVVGDSMCGVPLNKRLVEAYREVMDEDFPDITYPLEEVSKETIYLALKGYDELLGTHFCEHITVCERIHEPCGKDKICMPCRTQQEVFRRLGWVK